MYKLIMLPQPILVSDEEQKQGDFIIHKTLLDKISKCPDIYGSTQEHWYKIIAGIEGLPKIDLSAIAEEIGWVDVGKLAREYAQIHPTKDIDEEERYYNSNCKYYDAFKEGFKAAQNEKKFSEEEARMIWKAGQEYWKTSGDSITFEELIEKRQQLLSKPKEYNVEVETEYYYMSSKEFYGNDAAWVKCSKDNFDSIKKEIPSCPLKVEPKITNNAIKVTKILSHER